MPLSTKNAAFADEPPNLPKAHPGMDPGVVVGKSNGPDPEKLNVPELTSVSKFWLYIAPVNEMDVDCAHNCPGKTVAATSSSAKREHRRAERRNICSKTTFGEGARPLISATTCLALELPCQRANGKLSFCSLWGLAMAQKIVTPGPPRWSKEV